MFVVTLKSKDNHKYECKVDINLYDEKEITKIAFEKIKKDIEDFESFDYNLYEITNTNLI